MMVQPEHLTERELLMRIAHNEERQNKLLENISEEVKEIRRESAVQSERIARLEFTVNGVENSPGIVHHVKEATELTMKIKALELGLRIAAATLAALAGTVVWLLTNFNEVKTLLSK